MQERPSCVPSPGSRMSVENARGDGELADSRIASQPGREIIVGRAGGRWSVMNRALVEC